MDNHILIVIPARYQSTRLPGKPLHKIAGVEMIKRVAAIAAYVSACHEGCAYVVATDDERIAAFCRANAIPVAMTSPDCQSGTERCWDAVSGITTKPSLVINLQGDNPLCPPWFISQLIAAWKADSAAQVFTPCLHLSWEEYDAMQQAKQTTPFSGTTVLVDKLGYALAFSKMTIPAVRKEEKLRGMLEKSPVRRHIGLYAYTYEALKGYFEMEPSPYELPEGLEQMRFLHNRIPVKMVEADYLGRRSMSGVDSPEDVERAEAILAEYGEFDLSLHPYDRIGEAIPDDADKNAVEATFEAIITERLAAAVPSAKPFLINISGIPGSGKTTYYQKIAPSFPGAIFVGFDSIMEDSRLPYATEALSDPNAAFARWELPGRIAGYELLRRAAQAKFDIIFEHSSATEQHVMLFEKLIGEGYEVDFKFLDVPVGTAKQRVSAREARGGRTIPETYIETRDRAIRRLLPTFERICTTFETIDL